LPMTWNPPSAALPREGYFWIILGAESSLSL
jgi:hypothetical protein